jgi:hypothetical protein
MSLPADRARAYGFGALTGAFAAVALLARGRRRALAAAASLVCGALAVALEERQQRS